MEKSIEQQDHGEPNLRRSSRKRKPTKHSDFDYTFQEQFEQCKTPKTSRRSSKSSMQSSSSSIATLSVEVDYEPDSVLNTSDDDSLPILDEFSPTPIDLRLQISKMNPRQIIDSHCKSLETRLQFVAMKYLRSWTSSSPSFVAPYSLIVGDPSRYSATEPDDVAVSRVVRDMLDAVAVNQK